MNTSLKYEQHGHVALLTLNDPATRNALTGEEIFSAFEQAVIRINADLSIRAVILTGEGKAFCSGGNVRDMSEKSGMFGGTPEQIAEQYRTGIQKNSTGSVASRCSLHRCGEWPSYWRRVRSGLYV